MSTTTTTTTTTRDRGDRYGPMEWAQQWQLRCSDADRGPWLKLCVSSWQRRLASNSCDTSTTSLDSLVGDVNCDVISTSTSTCVEVRQLQTCQSTFTANIHTTGHHWPSSQFKQLFIQINLGRLGHSCKFFPPPAPVKRPLGTRIVKWHCITFTYNTEVYFIKCSSLAGWQEGNSVNKKPKSVTCNYENENCLNRNWMK